jgi:hypothetical protein
MKRYLAFAIVLLIIVSALVSCTDATDPAGTTAGNVTTNATGAVTTTATPLVIVTDSSNNGYSDIQKPAA